MTIRDQRGPQGTGIVIGLMIAGLGIILFFDQTGLLGWHLSVSIWPFLIIGAGLARLTGVRPDGSRRGGWLIFFGVWLLLHDIRILRFGDSWPLILVALGVHTIWNSLARPTGATRSQAGPS